MSTDIIMFHFFFFSGHRDWSSRSFIHCLHHHPGDHRRRGQQTAVVPALRRVWEWRGFDLSELRVHRRGQFKRTRGATLQLCKHLIWSVDIGPSCCVESFTVATSQPLSVSWMCIAGGGACLWVRSLIGCSAERFSAQEERRKGKPRYSIHDFIHFFS